MKIAQSMASGAVMSVALNPVTAFAQQAPSWRELRRTLHDAAPREVIVPVG
ncbi:MULTISPECIES: hypothetical protein [unclassified Brevundimonas]|uniref:hypothetical protein n=1 Tax=unclassified Brevundimonas TaxID=2622653 RepID=UPI0025C639B4|nr:MULTISPECIES: hypothetical protein [unclassified Brevundimonas]